MRNISAELKAELISNSVEPILLAEMFFDSGTIGAWTGIGDFTWNGKTFFGGGNFIGVTSIDETQELQAKGLTVSLNGISTSNISLALNERVRGRPFRLYVGTMNTRRYVATEDTPGRVKLEDGSGYVLLENQFIGEPYRIFAGKMDYMEFTDNGDSADIKLAIENDLIIGQRPKIGRYTNEDQRKRYPNDKGLEFINQLQDKEIVW